MTKPQKITFEGFQREVSVSPTIHYKSQGEADQLDLGFYAVYDHILYGVSYRGLWIKKYDDFQNNESFIFMLGWKKQKSFEVRYSYDFTLSKLAPASTGGAHEISMSILMVKSNKNKPMKRLPCPAHHTIKTYDFN